VLFTEFSATLPEQSKRSYAHNKDLVLKNKDDEPGVLEWLGKPISLAKGETVRTFFRYKLRRGLEDFYVMYFGMPTINPTLRLSYEANIEAAATVPDQRNGNEYSYRKVFLTGDHLNIRWNATDATK
jgi:hypothetical protein